MYKKFTTLQLLSLTDGRLSTTIDDVYDMLNHICDESLMTHHLPVAFNYLKLNNPDWYNQTVNVPQLKDEFDTSYFGKYMIENSLLINKK